MPKKVIRTHRQKIGAAPGALVHVGDRKVEKVQISVFTYDKDQLEEQTVSRIEDCLDCKDSPQVCWIDVVGIHQVDVLEQCGTMFGLHPVITSYSIHYTKLYDNVIEPSPWLSAVAVKVAPVLMVIVSAANEI